MKNQENLFLEKLENQLLNPNRDLSNLSAEEQFEMIMSKVGGISGFSCIKRKTFGEVEEV